MNDFINYIQSYSELLKKCSVWHNSEEIIAPVIGINDNESAADNYIYEFYCYIKIVEDLRVNYTIKFIEGEGIFKYKFPQAAALKRGKPRFHALQNETLQFQICAGTKINCEIDSEENHPDISFQIPSASDDPTQNELIFIMDAKYKENENSKLPKDEIYKFGQIVDLFDLRKTPLVEIQFSRYQSLKGNCLITNAFSYSDPSDSRLLQKLWIKEVERFSPSSIYKVIG